MLIIIIPVSYKYTIGSSLYIVVFLVNYQMYWIRFQNKWEPYINKKDLLFNPCVIVV